MQARIPHPFADLFDLEKKNSNPAILELLNTYLNRTAMLPLLESVTFSPAKDDHPLHLSPFITAKLQAEKNTDLEKYKRYLASSECSEPTRGLFFNYRRAWNIIYPLAWNNLYCLTLLGNLCESLGTYYYNSKDNKQAEIYYLSGLQIKIATHFISSDQQGTDIANSFNFLGIAYHQQGQYNISEMCYQSALSIALKCSNQKLTHFIGKIYYNASLNYIALSQSRILLEQNDPSHPHDVMQIDYAISCLSLADANLLLLFNKKLFNSEITKVSIADLRQQIITEMNAFKELKKIAPANPVPVKSTIALSELELEEEKRIAELMESTVIAAIDDEEPKRSSKISVANPSSNPTPQTATAPTASSESKQVLSFHLPTSLPTQAMPYSSSTRYTQTTMQSTLSKVEPVIHPEEKFNPHKKPHKAQERIQANLQKFQAEQRRLRHIEQFRRFKQLQPGRFHQIQSAPTFFPYPLNFTVPATNSHLTVKPIYDAERTKELGHNIPLYKTF